MFGEECNKGFDGKNGNNEGNDIANDQELNVIGVDEFVILCEFE